MIEFDESKRIKTLWQRDLDFRDAEQVFENLHFTAEDLRQNYGETRYITMGWLDARLVVLVWTWRGCSRRIISMRKANERECQKFREYLE